MNAINVVLLSGGSGKRLWPLSNDVQSKQFLKLLKNSDGIQESMVQRVARQIKKAHKNVNLFVSANHMQSDILNKQLENIEVIAEPTRRDTFPAIVLAAAYLYYKKGLEFTDAFIVCPIDPYAEAKYFELLSEVLKLVTDYTYEIGLMGAIPTYPSEKYGYIIQDSCKVSGFVEKPSETKSKELIAEGALWNCGVFALKIGYILDIAAKYIKFNSFEDLISKYESLPKISFDYEVLEKQNNIGVVIYDGSWKDLGTWNTLTEEMDDMFIGKVVVSDDCKNLHVLNMLNIPIMVQDIRDAVVVASYDGILVSSKFGSSFIKTLADTIVQMPMYEQHTWGNYRVLDYDDVSMTKRIRVDAGQNTILSGICIITKGKGILTIDGSDTEIFCGSVVQVTKVCSLSALSDMEFLNIQLEQDSLGVNHIE